ncbi:Outer membrane protein TolC [Saccharicrinis carchari]|uniref:Outer membrane protein TolC n=1 Tax=Saccharicrinis carchari TaxID=1168039 RepID=A0A521CI56_SACCC|nr:TolC family protein [Saccharicrinis carchari]SMO59108.1 Outer membrane protein TolC [Saccharicrinis carchari]
MTTKIKRLLVPLSLCFCSLNYAQSDTLEVTLNQAMAYATEFGYQSINAEHDIAIARKKVNETLAIGLPQISGNGTFNKNLLIQEIVAQIGGQTQRFKMGTDYSSTLSARADQLLFDGSYLVGLKASKVYVRLSENAKEKTDIEIKQAVAEVYFLAAIAQENIRDFKTSLEANKQIYEETKAYFENGLKEDTDVDQIKLMINESNRLYLEAKRQQTLTMAILKFSMGYDIDKPLKVSDNITELLSRIPVNPSPGENVFSHIDYRSLLTQMDIQGLDIKNQKALALPKLSAFASYDYTMLGDDLSELISTDGAVIGLSLSVPIFSSGQRSAQLKQKKLGLTKLNIERKMLEQSLERDRLIATTNLANAKEQYNNAEEALEIATRIYDKALLKFKNGLASSLELSQNENTMVEAIIAFRSAATNYFNMHLNYQKATAQL